MVRIFIGDTSEYLSQIAKNADDSATHLSSNNFQSKLNDGTYYTSLGDLGSTELLARLLMFDADEIVYCPPLRWSDIDKQGHSFQKLFTEYYCLVSSKTKKVHGLENVESALFINNMLHIEDARKSESMQLWVAGDSVAHGVGVDHDERYGIILSRKLNCPVSFLTKDGTSMSWAADQILRSDIRKNDIVVVSLTSEIRYTFMNNNGQVLHTTPAYFNLKNKKTTKFEEKLLLDLFSFDANNKLHYIQPIMQMVNFCNKIGAKLFLVAHGIRPGMEKYVYNLPNYHHVVGVNGIQNFNTYFDYGSDNMHPGPVTHQIIADKIFKDLKCEY